jgi:hypothetical protein
MILWDISHRLWGWRKPIVRLLPMMRP